jgi:3-dehydrosphinganine reductase
MAKGSKISFPGKRVLITGGSKGIGKETAKEIVRRGGSVALLARGKPALEQVKAELESLKISKEQKIYFITADAADADSVFPALDQLSAEFGLPDILINGVGYAKPNYVQNYLVHDYEDNMRINYLGQVIPTHYYIPRFMERGSGHISFVSSMMGFMGIIGYAAYAPTKFAVVGLAEVLRHELKPDNIGVSILFPPDTETPGFEEENKTKPIETAALSETAKLYPASDVAQRYVKGLQRGQFYIMFGPGKWIWRAFRWAPGLVHAITDQDLKTARMKHNL